MDRMTSTSSIPAATIDGIAVVANKEQKHDNINGNNCSYNVLILGASYGSLLSTKLLLAGHDVTLVCREATAKVFNEEGSIVRMPIRGRTDRVELKSASIVIGVGTGSVRARTPDRVLVVKLSDDNNDGDGDDSDKNYDLVVLAMQEPQYSAPDVRKLVQRVAAAKLPVMALTNMPLPPFLARIPGLEHVMVPPSKNDDDDDNDNIMREKIRSCYTDPKLWDEFMKSDGSSEVGLFTQCSPDPQAYRSPGESPNVLDVRLPTNFKAARFASDQHTAMLRQIEDDIQGIRYKENTNNDSNNDSNTIELPVKLRVHDSVFVPLAKWAMLLAGNYRCIEASGTIISIQEAVTRDVEAIRRVYSYVVDLCVGLGGSPKDFILFDKYLKAADSLKSPSSAAREIASGATNIERVDKIVALIGAVERQRHSKPQREEDDGGDDLTNNEKPFETIDGIVKIVDDWLEKNKTQNEQ